MPMKIAPHHLVLAIVLGLASSPGRADNEAAAYYEDALTRFERNDLEGTISQQLNRYIGRKTKALKEG